MAWTIVGLAALVLGAGWGPEGTVAVSSARTRNPGSALATAALGAPTGLTATPAGHGVGLSWTAGTNGSGYDVAGVANGSSSDCSAASVAGLGSSAGTNYTDAGRFSPQGSFYCYRVTTTYGGWTSVLSNPRASAQIGFVAVSTALSNGGTSGVLDTGDRIVVTFNQSVDPATGPPSTSTVCTTLLGPVSIGSTTTGLLCSVGETPTFGKLTGATVANIGRWNATYTWSNADKTLTIVLGTRTTGLLGTAILGSWSFNPTTTASQLLSATGAFHVCDTNAGGGACLPAATGSL